MGGKNLEVIVSGWDRAQFGVGHPKNISGGECNIELVAQDADYNILDSLTLGPGESVSWYYPPPGTHFIFVICGDSCEDQQAVLEYDTPIA